MAEHRPFPPSARRLGLARRAGLTAASPQVVAAVAWGAAALALPLVARAGAARIGAWITAACDQRATLAVADVPSAVSSLALPVLAVLAVAALAAQLAQTRTPWLPRRTVAGAPAVDRGPVGRATATARELAGAVVLGGVAFGWLWQMAPRLARLPDLSASDAVLAVGALLGSFGATLAIAWLAIGVLDALARSAEVAGALGMTDRERREDARLAAADPRWRARREAAARGPSTAEAVAAAAVVLLGDEAAVAIAWDPRSRPIPVRLAVGHGAKASQLVGLARRARIAVHRDAALVTELAAHEGPVPEASWARLASIIAALR